jgi:threonyl-tRNA synthetase
MRVLLLHANSFVTKIVAESDRPNGIKPEIRKSSSEEMKECLVCFFTVENGDDDKKVESFYTEIIKTAQEVGTKNLMISPFVHLSNNIASPKVSKTAYEQLLNKFKNSGYCIGSSHFGYHKSLQLDIKGHPGSFRYREF